MRPKTMKRILALLPLPLALCVRWVAACHPDTVERLFSAGLYPAIARPVGRAMALCPVPVIELALPCYLVLMVRWLLKRRFLRVAAACLLVPALFLCGWGLNYLRLPLEETLDLPVQPSTVAELSGLCDRLIDDANALAGTTSPDDLLSPAPAALDAAAQSWPIPAAGFAAPKYALSSPLLSRLLIEGVFSPWTLEPLVNRTIPVISIPFAACHESAHLRGFAREEDASLIAFLACEASDVPYYRYSGTVGALLTCLTALRSADMDAYTACRARLSPQVSEALAGHAAYWAAYRQTKTADIGQRVNDTYLQAVSGGEQSVRSYGRLADLLLALARKGEL